MALAPHGRTLAVSARWPEDGVIRLFDLKTGQLRATRSVGDEYMQSVAFLPDGRLVTAGDTALVWDVGRNDWRP
jgi:WD40 repeat protein